MIESSISPMSKRQDRDLTDWLRRWSQGEQAALDGLAPLVVDELRQMARRQLRAEPSGHTLEPTSLVNELFLRLLRRRRVTWQNRRQFFAFAGQAMRRLLVDHARRRRAAKRGQRPIRVSLSVLDHRRKEGDVDLLRLDDALRSLERMEPRQARVVELRFFGGLEHREVADALDLSEATVRRDWTSARAWLFRQLSAR